MFRVPLVTSSNSLSIEQFWKTVMLYHDRPHLINRKLAASSQALFCKVNFNSHTIKHISELFTVSSILYETRKLKKLENLTTEFVKNFLECYDKTVEIIQSNSKKFLDSPNGIFISVRILLPRAKTCEKSIEVVILDKNENKAIFLAVNEPGKTLAAPPFPYEIELVSMMNLRIILNSFEDADTSQAAWIADKLFPKLLKWASNIDDLDEENVQSLSLVSVDEYCLIYNRLKADYGDNLVKEWPNKSGTDPQKYVFEDLAIASYLICIWKHYDKQKIKFVDCGCGNGLLVSVLNQEGYKGFGIDLRRRPTWDIYPQDTKLEVGSVTPDSKFPDCTWLIGNHSDELTPWIPVIALRSSPKTNFFVLPCCPYDFSGQKYLRTNTKISVYADYLAYIKQVCEKCGFKTKIDKLRIPSTRRTCLVGIQEGNEYEKLNLEIDKYIETRLEKQNFSVRDSTEKVRNCTQLDRNLVVKIVKECVSNLLTQQNYIIKSSGEKWNKGGALTLSDLVAQLAKNDLKELKKECGGLQTLLRNHRYLFEFTEGKVTLRVPLRLEDSSKYKEKRCWFLDNHPDGCLHDATTCAYKHI